MEGSAISSFSSDPTDPGNPEEPETGKTVLKIVKLEAGTETPLEGAVFKVTNPDGTVLGHFSTGSDGTVSIPVTLTGHYTVEETVPPEWHLLDEDSTKHVQVVHGKTSIVTFANEPYGNLRVEKYSNKQLVFFNDRKPGIHLIKVDSADLSKPIANAKFEIIVITAAAAPICTPFSASGDGE